MFNATDVLAAILLPFAFAYGGYWTARSFGRSPDVSTSLGLCLAFVVGQLALESRGDWFGSSGTYLNWLSHGVAAGVRNVTTIVAPQVARNWIPWFVVAAAISGVLGKLRWQWSAMSASVAVAVLLPVRLLWSSVYLQPWKWTSVVWLVAIGSVIFAVCQVRSQTHREDRRLSAWLTWCTVAAAGVTLAMSGSMTYAQLGVAMANSLLGVLVAAIVFRDAVDWSLAETPICIAAAGLLILGAFFAEVTVVHTILLSMAMLLSRPFFALPYSPAVRRWIAVVLVGLLLTFVVAQAGLRFSHSIRVSGDPYAIAPTQRNSEPQFRGRKNLPATLRGRCGYLALRCHSESLFKGRKNLPATWQFPQVFGPFNRPHAKPRKKRSARRRFLAQVISQ